MAGKAWLGAGKKALARSAVQKTVASSLLTSYKKVKRRPEDFFKVSKDFARQRRATARPLNLPATAFPASLATGTTLSERTHGVLFLVRRTLLLWRGVASSSGFRV